MVTSVILYSYIGILLFLTVVFTYLYLKCQAKIELLKKDRDFFYEAYYKLVNKHSRVINDVYKVIEEGK